MSMQIVVMGDNDWTPERQITAHYGARWKAVRYNGVQARAEWLRDEMLWRDKVAGMPDGAVVQCRLVDSKPVFRAKP
jgi:hypothetical protein